MEKMALVGNLEEISDDSASVCDSLSEEGEIRSIEDEKPEIVEPVFDEYQLIGDSQFLRFAESMLNLKRKEKDGFSVLGLCVSGQKIENLLHRVETGFGAVSEKIVLMIGTNDLLRGTTFEKMHDDLKELLDLLSKNAKTIILLTLPPVPRLQISKYHWDRLKKYNEFIRGLHDGETVFVGDTYSEFVIPKESSASCSTIAPILAAEEDVIPLGLPSPKRHCRDPSLGPNNQGDSIHREKPRQYDNEDCSSSGREPVPSCDAVTSSNSSKLPSDNIMALLGSATTFDNPTAASDDPISHNVLKVPDDAVSSNGDTLLSGIKETPFGNSTTPVGVAVAPGDIMELSSDATSLGIMATPDDAVLVGNAISPIVDKKLPAENVMTSCDGAETMFYDATESSDDRIPSDVTKADGNAASLAGDTSSLSGITDTPFSDAVIPSGVLVSPSDNTMEPVSNTASRAPTTPVVAVSFSGSAISPTLNAKLPAGDVTSCDDAKTMADGVTESSGNKILTDATNTDEEAVLPARDAISYSSGAEKLTDVRVTPSDDGATSSGEAVEPSFATASLLNITAAPSDAVSLSDDATLVSDGAIPLISGSSSPLSNVTSSVGVTMPSGKAISLCCSRMSSPDVSLTPSSCGTPSLLAFSMTTPFSGENDALTSSEKYHSLKRKRQWNEGGDYVIEIPNADKIRDEYFEKYYDKDKRRPDLIHLNSEGLRVIERIMQDSINASKKVSTVVSSSYDSI